MVRPSTRVTQRSWAVSACSGAADPQIRDDRAPTEDFDWQLATAVIDDVVVWRRHCQQSQLHPVHGDVTQRCIDSDACQRHVTSINHDDDDDEQ